MGLFTYRLAEWWLDGPTIARIRNPLTGIKAFTLYSLSVDLHERLNYCFRAPLLVVLLMLSIILGTMMPL